MVFELVTTRNCNLNCKYCFEGKKKNSNMEILSIPKLINFIETIKEKDYISNKARINIDFNGGEALLNKEFIQSFILQTKDLNYNYTLTTNGLLIDSEIIELINKYNIDFQISIDGKKDTHDYNRVFYDGTGSFDSVYLKIKEVQNKCKNVNFNISLVYTSETVNRLYENIEFLVENNINDIVAVSCPDIKWNQIQFEILKSQLEKIGKLYIKKIEEGRPFNYRSFKNCIENTLKGLIKNRCDAVIGEIAILPDGKILPCGGFVGCKNEEEFYIGDIYTGINEDKVKFYIRPEKFLENKDCIDCSLFKRCQNDCFAVNNRINNNILKIDETRCNTNQLEIIESDHILDYFLRNRNKEFYNIFSEYLREDYLS